MDGQTFSLFPLLASAALFFIGYGMGTKATLKRHYIVDHDVSQELAADDSESLMEQLDATCERANKLCQKVHEQKQEIEGLVVALDQAEARIWRLRNQVMKAGCNPEA